jgi:hypothetical protein
MLESTHKNLNVSVGVCKKMPDIAVIMGIPYVCDWECLNQLSNNSPCGVVYSGAESAALGYALYETVRDKFMGSPLEISKSRVSRVSCNSQDGHFVITWNTQGSMSLLRRTVAFALGTLAPTKLFAKYSENMKLLGGKANREHFNTYAHAMATAIKKGIHVAVVGKINIDAKKLNELTAKAYVKLPDQVLPSAKEMSKPEKRETFKRVYPTIKASGIAAVVVADYVQSRAGGMSVAVDNDEVVVYNMSWKTKHAALKSADRINDYVDKKYKKLGDDFPCILAYLSIIQNLASCHTVKSIIKSKPKPSDVSALIKKSL